MAETKLAPDPSEKGRESTMKPLHVGILVMVAAVGGGLFTKWQTSRNVAPMVAARSMAPAPPAAAEKPAVMRPVAAQRVAAQRVVNPDETTAQVRQARPSALSEDKPRKEGKTRPIQPRMVAQSAPRQ